MAQIIRNFSDFAQKGTCRERKSYTMFRKLRAKIRRRRADEHAKRLLSVGKDQIRLQDIPESYRLSEDHGLTLHIYAFRADRNISLERYQQDLGKR